MKFDWYQASIPRVEPSVVMAALAASEYYGDWEKMKPLKGYDNASQFVVGNQTVFKIQYGGQNEEYGSNVIGSGGYAQKLADVLRKDFPVHRVSRVDSCEDYHHGDAYDYLREKALSIAEKSKLDVREIVKPLASSDDGRTLYLGSVTSVVQMRVYEKGKQLGCSPDWVRAELQVRPKKDAKSIVSLLSPEDLWGMAKWSLLMASEMGNSNIQRVDANIYQKSDQERAYRFLLKQYGRLLGDLMPVHGSWESLGAQIGYDLGNMEEYEERMATKLVNRKS
jgi:DNA relaxase NicK